MNSTHRFCLANVLFAATFALATTAQAQMDLPAPVQVPAGNKVAMETVGKGEITYECRDKANAAGQTEWTFVGPKAVLDDRAGKQVGTYYGPPATWQSADGSKVTGTQVAVAPAGDGNLPYQLVKANKGKQEVVKYQADYIFWSAK